MTALFTTAKFNSVVLNISWNEYKVINKKYFVTIIVRLNSNKCLSFVIYAT